MPRKWAGFFRLKQDSISSHQAGTRLLTHLATRMTIRNLSRPRRETKPRQPSNRNSWTQEERRKNWRRWGADYSWCCTLCPTCCCSSSVPGTFTWQRIFLPRQTTHSLYHKYWLWSQVGLALLSSSIACARFHNYSHFFLLAGCFFAFGRAFLLPDMKPSCCNRKIWAPVKLTLVITCTVIAYASLIPAMFWSTLYKVASTAEGVFDLTWTMVYTQIPVQRILPLAVGCLIHFLIVLL